MRRPDAAGSVDVLFIDEAAQMSLANVLAVSQAAQSIVLLGDPRQLEQPIQGSHPDGVDVSSLDHILGPHATVPADRGLFLAETWRLHPLICAFNSEMFYESRLHPRPGLENQAIRSKGRLSGAGLRYIAVEHRKRAQRGSRGQGRSTKKRFHGGLDGRRRLRTDEGNARPMAAWAFPLLDGCPGPQSFKSNWVRSLSAIASIITERPGSCGPSVMIKTFQVSS